MVSRIPKIELYCCWFVWLSGCWLLFLILFSTSSRNYIDPHKAVQELFDWVYTKPTPSENVERNEGIDFEIDNEEDAKLNEVITSAISSSLLCGDIISSSADLITEGQQIISALPTKTEMLVLDEQSSLESVLLAAALDVFNDEESLPHTITPDEQVPLEKKNLSKTPEKTEVSSSSGNPVRYCKCVEKEKACKLCKKSEFYNIDWDDVNKSFWRRDFVRRRSWFDAHVKIIEPVRRTVPDTVTEPVAKAKRTRTLEYYLPANKDTGLKVRVCKSAFLSTLRLKTGGRVIEFVRHKTTSGSSPTIDHRGSWFRKEIHLVEKDKIREHIESYKSYVSHYTRKNAPNRRYLDSELNIVTMHKSVFFLNFAKM